MVAIVLSAIIISIFFYIGLGFFYKKDVFNIGDIIPVIMEVMKYGRSTRKTTGIIDNMEADIKVAGHNEEGVAVFEDQIEITNTTPGKRLFSDGGDSGSIIIDLHTKKAVGLLFSGLDDGTTFANNINEVFNGVKQKLSNFTIV